MSLNTTTAADTFTLLDIEDLELHGYDIRIEMRLCGGGPRQHITASIEHYDVDDHDPYTSKYVGRVDLSLFKNVDTLDVSTEVDGIDDNIYNVWGDVVEAKMRLDDRFCDNVITIDRLEFHEDYHVEGIRESLLLAVIDHLSVYAGMYATSTSITGDGIDMDILGFSATETSVIILDTLA